MVLLLEKVVVAAVVRCWYKSEWWRRGVEERVGNGWGGMRWRQIRGDGVLGCCGVGLARVLWMVMGFCS